MVTPRSPWADWPSAGPAANNAMKTKRCMKGPPASKLYSAGAAVNRLRRWVAVELLTRPLRERGARRVAVGGEGLAESVLQTLTSQASLEPLLSREKREREWCGSAPQRKT